MSRFYRTFRDELAETYPFPVRKVALDAGLTCPNRDGAKARGGCVYCENRSFAPGARLTLRPVAEQIAASRASRPGPRIAYFQAYTNTYAPVETLRALYDEALAQPEIVGLAVATRPDCLPEATLDLLAGYAKRLPVWLEIGVETSHDRTLEGLNRAHTWADFENAVTRSRSRGLRLTTHTIFGLAGESHAEMMETVDRLAAMPLTGIKIHHLYVARNTALERLHAEGRVRTLSLTEWTALAVDVIERLPATLSVHRVMGEIGGPYVVAPLWGVPTDAVLAAIDAEFGRRGSRQGSALRAPVRPPTADRRPLPPMESPRARS